jgi:hypothetical protein
MQPFEKLHGRERIEREGVEAQEERRDLGSLQLCVLLLPLGSLYIRGRGRLTPPPRLLGRPVSKGRVGPALGHPKP